MRRIVNDITNGRNVEENLKKYSESMKGYYNKYALVRLALNYYTYFQIDIDNEGKENPYKDISDITNRVIKNIFVDNIVDRDEDIKSLDNCRANILERVEALTYYVDAFKLYEHALNRVEYRFRDDVLSADYSDEALCREIMQYILSDEDSVVINSKIAEIIAELPIRMTKGKFFEYVSNGLSIYKGSDEKALDDFIYLIRTTAMINNQEKYAQLFPELEETLIGLKESDYSNIQKEEYSMLIRTIEDISVYIEDVMNVSIMLMEILNDTYSVLLSIGSEESEKAIDACKEIIVAVNDYFILGSEIDEETEDLFILLEGKQEELYSKISLYNILDEIEKAYSSIVEEGEIGREFKELKKLAILSSDSIFVELEENIQDRVVDDEILEDRKEKLIQDLTELFGNNPKSINRAVMSAVLAQLPVFFNNISELQDYIYNTLDNCTDKAEKIACVEVLRQIMEE